MKWEKRTAIFSRLLIKKFKEENKYSIHNGNSKNSFRCLIPAGVDVVGEKCYVAHKAPHSKKSDEAVGSDKHLHKLAQFVPRKAYKINDDENEEGS